MKVNVFTKEGMHAEQAKFCLLVLISKSVTYVSDVTNRR